MHETHYSARSSTSWSTSIGSRVHTAIERGIAFLERSQRPSGELRVCTSRDPAMAGAVAPDPSVFPTALMAHSLSFAPGAAAVRERALGFLLAESDRNGLWRHWTREHPHHRELPPDLDDTACASAALSHSGRAFVDNRELLLANRDGRGLFFTWITLRPRWNPSPAHRKVTLAQLRHAPTLYFFFRRTSAAPEDVDAVVNANVLFYLGAVPETRPVVDHLMDVLRAGRETACDKWYENPFAVWYFFSRALSTVAPEAGEIIVDQLASARPASVLDAALAACSLLYWERLPCENAIAGLLSAQLDSGAWPRAALYHGGRARLRDGSFAAPHPDTPHWGSEELTTACCIEATARWLALSLSS